MNPDSKAPLRLFLYPFAAWRELALKTAEMITASAYAGAAQASAPRVAVIDERDATPSSAAARTMARPARPPKRNATASRRKAQGGATHRKKRARRR
jgi:hypothetical protein